MPRCHSEGPCSSSAIHPPCSPPAPHQSHVGRIGEHKIKHKNNYHLNQRLLLNNPQTGFSPQSVAELVYLNMQTCASSPYATQNVLAVEVCATMPRSSLALSLSLGVCVCVSGVSMHTWSPGPLRYLYVSLSTLHFERSLSLILQLAISATSWQ